ncbi:MAG: peptidase S1, partial [Spirochaetales bacterium]
SIEELQFLLLSHSVQSIVSIDYKSSNNESDIVRIPCYLNIRPENPGIEMYKREPLYKAIYPMFGMELVPSSAVNKNQFTVQSIVNGSIADESGFSVHDPVEILRSRILPDDAGIYIETFTKNRKNGYMEVGLAVGAPLDSPLFF